MYIRLTRLLRPEDEIASPDLLQEHHLTRQLIHEVARNGFRYIPRLRGYRRELHFDDSEYLFHKELKTWRATASDMLDVKRLRIIAAKMGFYLSHEGLAREVMSPMENLLHVADFSEGKDDLITLHEKGNEANHSLLADMMGNQRNRDTMIFPGQMGRYEYCKKTSHNNGTAWIRARISMSPADFRITPDLLPLELAIEFGAVDRPILYRVWINSGPSEQEIENLVGCWAFSHYTTAKHFAQMIGEQQQVSAQETEAQPNAARFIEENFGLGSCINYGVLNKTGYALGLNVLNDTTQRFRDPLNTPRRRPIREAAPTTLV